MQITMYQARLARLYWDGDRKKSDAGHSSTALYIFLNIRMNNNYNVSQAKLAEVNVAVSRSCNQLSWLAPHMQEPMHCPATGMHVNQQSLVGEVKMQCCELPTE